MGLVSGLGTEVPSGVQGRIPGIYGVWGLKQFADIAYTGFNCINDQNLQISHSTPPYSWLWWWGGAKRHFGPPGPVCRRHWIHNNLQQIEQVKFDLQHMRNNTGIQYYHSHHSSNDAFHGWRCGCGIDHRVRPIRLASWSTGGLLYRKTTARSTDDVVCRSTQSSNTHQRGVVSHLFTGSRPQ